MRMLLADDQELVRETIAAFLRLASDITVEVARDLPHALEMVRTSPRYDHVMLDYMMPGMNRLGGLQVMRQATPGAPVAILSGAAPQVLAEQALAAGSAGFVPKTILTRSMLAAVRFMAAGEICAPFTPQTGAETAAPPGRGRPDRTRSGSARGGGEAACQDTVPQDRRPQPHPCGVDRPRNGAGMTVLNAPT